LKEGEKCDMKKEGMGCVEKFCCGKVTAYDAAAVIDKLPADAKK